MKPKGHKKGCPCVICARVRPRRKNIAKKRVARRNHGMESQMRALVRSAPKKAAKRKNSAVRMRNPDDLGCMGNPGGGGRQQWFMLDMFDKKGPIATSIEQTTAASARDGAKHMLGRTVGRKRVQVAQLSGPYSTRPSASTVRK